ncbi:MAG: (Fe-S)-binding protein [Bacteroidales bacterium]|nr:(Fe-S)-binding protein [Bacteroidales bacterium]
MEQFIILPFLIGFSYLIVVLIYRFIKWIRGLSKMDKLRLVKSLRIKRILVSLKEVFFESLLHRKIIKKNPVLGYMHMSLAFGWFLLIVIGHLEAVVAKDSLFVPVYIPVFFRYFESSKAFAFSGIFTFVMDLLLLFVLTGLFLAIIKRFKKRIFGLKRTTRLKTGDRIALLSLWLIFPLRLLAESTSAAIHNNGGFLTSTFGNVINQVFNPEIINFPFWVAYSAALGFFFVALPNSRYMHIPAEVLFIFIRNAGIKLKKQNNTYTDIQVFSCSRCGICLDDCQLTEAGIQDTQSVYILKRIRNKNLTDEQLFNCLMCGKCQSDCPVGIDTIDLRITQRIESTLQYNSSYNYLDHLPAPKAETVYYAGCMTHLTPGIINAMVSIFAIVGEQVWFMDQEKAPCCGRPLMHAGQYTAASKLIENNSNKIIASGAKRLIVSCPICYKVFKEDYQLPHIEVQFHADYILGMIQSKRLNLMQSGARIVYHDPCELGRGMQMYDQPREVLKRTGNLIAIKNEKELAHCCGGSLGNLKIKQQERKILQEHAVNDYLQHNPDLLITACPMCKKTFNRNKGIKVLDIAEVVLNHIIKPPETFVHKNSPPWTEDAKIKALNVTL